MDALPNRPVAVLAYPSFLHGPPDSRAAAVVDLVASLPGVEVLDLRDRSPESFTPSERASLARARTALVLDVPDWLFGACPALDVVQTISTGVDQIDLEVLQRAGCRLASGSGTSATEIAEFVLARLLEHWKRLPELAALQVERRWTPLFGRSMSDARITLVGFGPINQALARLLGPFNSHLTAVRRTPGADSPGVHEVLPMEALDRALQRADAIVCAVPSTLATTGLFDARRFEQMQQGAFFCNVGRGSAVVEADLVAALDAGRLGGAALDVVEHEPLEPGSPLWSSPIRISPHCATVPPMAMRRALTVFSANTRHVQSGARIENEVALT